jgi:iron complex outermembrane receptor protein
LVTTCAVSNASRTATPPVRLFTVDCSGKPGVNSPKWTANLSYEHRFVLGGDYELTAGGRSRLETSSYLNLDYLSYQKRGSYSNTDAFLTLSGPERKWSLTGFVNNIENSVVKAGGLTRPIVNVTLLAVRPPRTYGVRAGYKF